MCGAPPAPGPAAPPPPAPPPNLPHPRVLRGARRPPADAARSGPPARCAAGAGGALAGRRRCARCCAPSGPRTPPRPLEAPRKVSARRGEGPRGRGARGWRASARGAPALPSAAAGWPGHSRRPQHRGGRLLARAVPTAKAGDSVPKRGQCAQWSDAGLGVLGLAVGAGNPPLLAVCPVRRTLASVVASVKWGRSSV